MAPLFQRRPFYKNIQGQRIVYTIVDIFAMSFEFYTFNFARNKKGGEEGKEKKNKSMGNNI